MTLLRSRTATALASWPDVPVVYRRPVLRILGAIFLVGEALWTTNMVWFPPRRDPLPASEWWLDPLIFAMLGGLYLYLSARLTITRTHVVVDNPLRRATVPLGHVISVQPGSSLKIRTAYGSFCAWGVESGSVQVVAGTGTQVDLAQLLRRAAAQATGGGRPARYRWRRPDAFLAGCAFIAVINAVALSITGAPS